MEIRAHQIQVALPTGRELFSIADLKIRSGEHVLIQGQSGSGKTTFLHLLAGLFLPQSGNVFLGSYEITALRDEERGALRVRHVGVIFQKLNLLDHLTVSENIELTAPADRIAKAVARVNLKGRENHRVSYMSLGEQQRVAVARVLAQEPDVILADEPTSSLDEDNASDILQALKAAARGKTLVVVSHDRRIADKFDRVLQFGEFCR